MDGSPLPDHGSAAIIAPAGARGPGFAVYHNFFVIKKYNNATSYAMGVGHLGDRIMGGGPFQGAWPRGERELSRTEKIELQERLIARGHDTGATDGVIGPEHHRRDPRLPEPAGHDPGRLRHRPAPAGAALMADASRKLAVLIDADNTSPKVADGLFEEVAKIGEASLRRIYGDFSKGQQAGWEKLLARHAILPTQQFAYTTGKNSTDITLVIDAMDLLHSGRFDGFCLVSSDSDFTRLAARIREQGIDVYGIGQQKTPEAFRQACTRFIFTENFVARARPPGHGHVVAPPDVRGGRADQQGAGAARGRRRGLVPARHRRPAPDQPLARVRHPHLRPCQAQRPRRGHRPLRHQPRRPARPPPPEARPALKPARSQGPPAP